jgi:hypothetical protein
LKKAADSIAVVAPLFLRQARGACEHTKAPESALGSWMKQES